MDAKQQLLSALSRAKPLALCLLLIGAAAPFGGDSGLAAQVSGGAANADPNLERAIAEQLKLVETRRGARARAMALNDLANLLELRGDIPAALESYTAAIVADGTLASAHYNLALLAYATGDTELASRRLETAVELEPGNAWAHYQLGRIADDAGEAEKAVERYVHAVSLDSRLAFGDVNPHFLVNSHATEILLRADRTPVKALPPRTYSAPRRISGLLLPARVEETAPRPEEVAESPKVPEDDADGADAVEAVADQGETGRTVEVGGDRRKQAGRSPAPAAPAGIGSVVFREPTVRSVTYHSPVTAAVPDEPAEPAADRRAGREPRVFTRDDLRTRTLAVGGAVVAPATGRQPSSSPASGRRGAIQEGTPVGPGGRQPAPGTFGGSRGGRFEPSPRSSAQLDVTIRRFPAPAL